MVKFLFLLLNHSLSYLLTAFSYDSGLVTRMYVTYCPSDAIVLVTVIVCVTYMTQCESL
jgi:hypothetical protein